jgi:hypothetical protein
MLTFPTLKTQSAVQYPFQETQTFATEVLQFLAGDEQRYSTTPGSLRNWKVRLDLLDEAELKAVEEFFVAASGSFTTFSFTDPGTGSAHPNCYIAGDVLAETLSGELRSGVTIVIQEGRAALS